MNLGGTELIILLVIVMVVFGGSALPKAARNLGKAKVEIDKAQKTFEDTKAQVIETTGLDKADAALRKANRTLNQSPQGMMRQAAKKAVAPPVARDAEASGDSGAEVEAGDGAEVGAGGVGGGGDAVDEMRPAGDPGDETAAEGANVNVDFSDD